MFSCVWLFATPWTVSLGSFVHGILQARILEWVALLPVQGSNPGVLQLQAGFLLSEPLGKPFLTVPSVTLSNCQTHIILVCYIFLPGPYLHPRVSFFFLIYLWFLVGLGLFCCVGFSLVVAGWGYSSCPAQASRCGALARGHMVSQ